MKAKDIQVGKTYAVKVSNTVVPVIVLEAFESFRSSLASDPRGRTNWKCKNTITGREIVVKSAQRFRHEIGPNGKPLFESVNEKLEKVAAKIQHTCQQRTQWAANKLNLEAARLFKISLPWCPEVIMRADDVEMAKACYNRLCGIIRINANPDLPVVDYNIVEVTNDPNAQEIIKSSGEPTDPIMRQYQAAKDKHPGMLLLFRIGDFYELFDQDAEKVSKLIGLTLTSRNGFPMCGFPHHQFEAYLHKLLKEGQKVAICEQVQDPANVPVRREVQRIVVPGEEGEPCTPRT